MNDAWLTEFSSQRIVALHDAAFDQVDWPIRDAQPEADGIWKWVKENHRQNHLLWDEEDQARRRDVPAETIMGNKRAIDGFNQKRNDAVERIDEMLLIALAGVSRGGGARLNSETAGSMVDRLSILALKVRAMTAQTLRTDADSSHVDACRGKLAKLVEQRSDLASCLDELIQGAEAGRVYFKIYRQFKMYNDPTLNPALYTNKKS